jgi:hypothetical protein
MRSLAAVRWTDLRDHMTDLVTEQESIMTDLVTEQEESIMTDLLREKIVQINPLQKKQPLVGINKADIWIILEIILRESIMTDLRSTQEAVSLLLKLMRISSKNTLMNAKQLRVL